MEQKNLVIKGFKVSKTLIVWCARVGHGCAYLYFFSQNRPGLACTELKAGIYKGKIGKEEYLYSAFIQRLVSKRSDMDHTVLPANYTMLPFLRKRSSDGASTKCGGEHLIAAHYSFIDPERMKG